MLSNGFETPIKLTLKNSTQSLLFRVAVHLLALFAITVPFDLSVLLKILLFVFVLASLLFCCASHVVTLNKARRFNWFKDDKWIETTGFNQKVWSVQHGSIITAWFVVVTLHDSESKLRLLINRDQCRADTFRRLCVRLKFLKINQAGSSLTGKFD